MGRPGAYLEVERREHAQRTADVACGDFSELAVPLTLEEQRRQASRCMNCGVGFCQTGISFGGARTSGCPLHNLIPEWNDLLFRGRLEEAYERLTLTNPFPEFTGRVCPALCEAACNLGFNDEPTTIRDNERQISDHAWASPAGPVALKGTGNGPRVAVVGAGPAGLACAWELATKGCRVTLLERDEEAGGLLMYGIPNMKLPKDVVRRRVELMRASGIEVRCGVDVNDADEGARLLAEFQATIVATGSRRARTLTCEGADLAGVVLAVDYLSDATRALLSHEEPRICARGLDVVVIGGGDTGTDCVATATRQGARSVRQLEFLPEPPRRRQQDNPWPEWPKTRKDDYGQEEAKATYGRDPRQWGTETLAVEGADGHVCGLRTVSLDWSCGRPQRIEGTERTLEARLVLIAMGFVGPEPKALRALGVTCADDPRALPLCDAGTHRASCVHDAPVFVAGDCRTGSTLVVSAIADGIACAREVACALGL